MRCLLDNSNFTNENSRIFQLFSFKSTNVFYILAHQLTLMHKCDECGGEIINKNGDNFCEKCGLVHELVLESSSFSIGPEVVSTPEDYVFRVCSIICRNEQIQQRIWKYYMDPYVYEKLLQIVSLKMLEKIPTLVKKRYNYYPLAVVAAYFGARGIAKKKRRRLALTQKLVSSTTNLSKETIKEYVKLFLNYDYTKEIKEVSSRF